MNKAALWNFLRHLLFLLVILELISGIIIFADEEKCSGYYNKPILPLNAPLLVYKPFFISVDMKFSILSSIGFMVIVISIVGFYGAMHLNNHELINAAVGGAYLVLALVQIVSVYIKVNMQRSFDIIIDQNLADLFYSSNGYINMSLLDRWNRRGYNQLFSKDYVDGWNEMSLGNAENHSYIDFTQFMNGCCGLTGRYFWEISVPNSCCSEEIANVNCTAMVAYDRSCSASYGRLRDCLVSVLYEFVFFSFLSLAAGGTSLYLAYMKVKYFQGEYITDLSSVSSEEYDETSF